MFRCVSRVGSATVNSATLWILTSLSQNYAMFSEMLVLIFQMIVVPSFLETFLPTTQRHFPEDLHPEY
jgi:hypothetical protein